MTYKLPEPDHTLKFVSGDVPLFTAEQIQAASAAGLAARVPEVAWLIECSLFPRPEWLCARSCNCVEFSSDPNKATRFSRRADAQGVLDLLKGLDKLDVMPPLVYEFYKVTEHMWPAAPEPTK